MNDLHPQSLGLSSEKLGKVFPFHVGFDRKFRLLQAGPVISRLLPELRVGSLLSDHFNLERSAMHWDFDAIVEQSESLFLLRALDQRHLILRGQMLPLGGQDALFFLGSPWVTEVGGLQSRGLEIDDFAVHDPVTDFLQILEAKPQPLAKSANLASELAEANRQLKSSVDNLETMEHELRMAQKLESIGQLAAGIAHEINTPTQYVGDNTRFLEESFGDITPIIKQAAILADAVCTGRDASGIATELQEAIQVAGIDYLSEEIPLAIEQSLGGIERVRKIVRAMKEFSHPGVDGMTSLDLNRAIESTIMVATNEWKYVAVVETELDPELPAVSCLPGEISQVILNMIVNASHAIADALPEDSDDKGTITVSTRCDGEFAEFRVQDTGTGITEEARSKIFDSFFTTKEAGKGTGQGLSLAHRVVVKKHGGSIDVETEVGKGTTFIVRLPLQQETSGDPLS
jgi:signal transduction histidine kinase